MSYTEYGWLTGPIFFTDDAVLGSGKGHPLPFLLRHGGSQIDPAVRFDPSTFDSAAKENHLWLPARDAEGRDLGPDGAYFLLQGYGGTELIICDKLVSESGLEAETLNPGGASCRLSEFAISRFSWQYQIPLDPDSIQLYRDVHAAVKADDSLDDDELLLALCKRFKARVEPLQGWYWFLPGVRSGSKEPLIHVQGDSASIEFSGDTTVGGLTSQRPFGEADLATQPVLGFHGILMPMPLLLAIESASSESERAILRFLRVRLSFE